MCTIHAFHLVHVRNTHTTIHAPIYATHMHTCTHSYITHSYINPHLHTCRNTNHMHWQSVAHKEITAHLNPDKYNYSYWHVATSMHLHDNAHWMHVWIMAWVRKSMTVYVDASCNWCMCLSQCFVLYILCMYVSVYIVGVCGGVHLYVSHFLQGNSFTFTTSYSLVY